MASIGHVLVGLAVARAHDTLTERAAGPRPTRMRLAAASAFALLSLVPDLDVIGFRFGIAYEDALGHRGASHSLLIAVIIGLLAAPVVARGARASLLPTAIAAVVVVSSHGVLDMLTDGGLGIALGWPWSDERFFAPWRPLPVAPIGRAFVSSRGLLVGATELVLFLPFALFGVFGVFGERRPRRGSR